jgi:enoyl-CoA hydratase/carnithine racemase
MPRASRAVDPLAARAAAVPPTEADRRRTVRAVLAGVVAGTYRRIRTVRPARRARPAADAEGAPPECEPSGTTGGEVHADGRVLVERTPPCATVTLNRPEHRNAITAAMWAALAAVFAELAADRAIRVVVLRGAGDKAFSAGADIAEFRTRMIGQAAARDYWREVDAANSTVENCPKPVVAVVSGFALGAACALVSACDLRIATPNALLGVPAARIGLTLALNDTRRLVGAIGASHARNMLLTGRLYSAAEALVAGLVTTVVPADEVEAELQRLVALIADQAPLALRQAKVNLNIVARNPGFAGINEVEVSLDWAGSRDFAEGISAYLERRKPRFAGA